MEKSKILTMAEMPVKPLEDKRCEKNGKWEKPKLEDVSGKVMAQPYIRFT